MKPSDKFVITRGELADLIALSLSMDRAKLVDGIISQHTYAKAAYVHPVDPMDNPRVPIGTTWFEKTRPGHIVQIVGLRWSRRGSYMEIIYKHIGTHNKRPQRNNTVTPEGLFLRRYEEVKA